jgi:putative oxidoreductase
VKLDGVERGGHMQKPSNLELSLLIMRLATAAFLLVWAIDKIVNHGHAENVFKTFYFATPPSQVLTSLGVVQALIVLGFAVGFARFWTYGAVLLMHVVSTVSTYARLINPWGQGAQLLFWAAVPVLATMIALFLLREQHRLLSIDARRGSVAEREVAQ